VAAESVAEDISVGMLQNEDVEEAERIFRIAFGTFLGVPNPEDFRTGVSFVRTRWKKDPTAAYAAKLGKRLLGTNFATNWGSVGFFGPLTIYPEYWDRGVGKRLMEPIMQLFEEWNTRHAGLFTFAQSPKHVGLYQRYGFLPRYLTALMARIVSGGSQQSYQLFSQLTPQQKEECLQTCSHLTNEIYDGLNVSRDIDAVDRQSLGDTLLLWEDSKLAAFAVCHCGEETEAGPDTCYIKFAAVQSTMFQSDDFARLLSACDTFASQRELKIVFAGVNTGRIEAYQEMLRSGFRTQSQGVAMHKSNDVGYSRAGVFVLDDWR